ncbi:MAG: hypothetical protein WDZ77_01360 [Candidatus Pacearchaeota archaeon]
MLNKKQIEEVREHLDRAQNPVFLFDNDVDGLCSFLVLRRFCQKGRGFPIKTFPALGLNEFQRAQELGADYLFVLDKPLISEEFFEEAQKYNLPIVWIDHHKTSQKIPEFVSYYNPLDNSPESEIGEPTTFLCHQISQRKEDLWLAIIGSVSDGFIPEFYFEFKKEYPDLVNSKKDKTAFDLRYGSQLGKIIRILSFAMKDRIRNVVILIKFLIESKGPYEILNEVEGNELMHERFLEIEHKYKRLIDDANNEFSKNPSNKLLFFKYAGDMSISADLANKLYHDFPDKYIIVAYDTGFKLNISGRGNDVRRLVAESVKGLKDATSGGHREAVGARIKSEDVDKFRENLEREIGE